MTPENTPANAPSWHDNLIYGIHLQSADPDRGIWRSNLVLDIDHIVEWICGEDRQVSFLVAPATLVFHDVTDLRIDVDFGADGSGGQRININELSIAQIVRDPVERLAAVGAPPHYAWRIELNLPQGSKIGFGASGYTQTLRSEPQLIDEQRLPADTRAPLILP
ncbi:MAG TPA: hypothetical protein VMY41_00945 [Thermohalobaculum sp.]|nr:hypothetical protein [Thermohalobaculum sp.]